MAAVNEHCHEWKGDGALEDHGVGCAEGVRVRVRFPLQGLNVTWIGGGTLTTIKLNFPLCILYEIVFSEPKFASKNAIALFNESQQWLLLDNVYRITLHEIFMRMTTDSHLGVLVRLLVAYCIHVCGFVCK